MATLPVSAIADDADPSVEAKDRALAADIRLVGRVLGDVVRADSGAAVFQLV